MAKEPLKDASKTNYDQWRAALSKDGVTNPVQLELLPGYQLEVVRVAEPDEGSWINLAFDDKGRLVICREDQGLLRFTLSDDKKAVKNVETIENTLLECRGILFAHGCLYLSANNSKGIYRLKDTDGNDTYDEVKLLKTIEGGVGHGRNCLALGPDDKIYLACGNNVQVPADISEKSPYRNYGLDRLLPCIWNEFLFDSDVVPPAGFVMRTDADGREWELFAGGFRNEYGLAFNGDGELFTYDADMEWDEGAPWYRPTCVLHVVPGGEYGWRQGTSVWPEFFDDSLPRVVDIGLGSPTAIQFGAKSRFPEKYRRALFILDWAYGRIIAVHLQPDGASYQGNVETFIKGKPLNVTGLDFGPDGAMYFTVGGRRTQSALYRVSYMGNADDASPEPDDKSASNLRELRRKLEQAAREPDKLKNTHDLVTKHLDHADRWIRFAARRAMEKDPFQTQASVYGQKSLMTDINLLILKALGGDEQSPAEAFDALMSLSTDSVSQLSREQRIVLWRALQLATIRSAKKPQTIPQFISDAYPADSFPENNLLCELLVYLNSPDVIEKTLRLFDAAPNQQEKLFYLFTLRHVSEGWTLDQRRKLLQGLKESEEFEGAQYMARFVSFIRTDCLNTFTPSEQQELSEEISQLGASSKGIITSQPRPFVKQWSLAELTSRLDHVTDQRNRERGKALFVGALCAQCHRREDLGRAIGPGLDSASAKFSRKDLLETIMAPSKVVDEKYRLLMVETDAGKVIVGQLVGGDKVSLSLAPSLLEPTRIDRVRRNQIVSRMASPTSPMPEGLLNSLSEEEILDLLAFLEFGSAR